MYTRSPFYHLTLRFCIGITYIHTYNYLQNKVQQCITIKTWRSESKRETEMVGDRNTRKAKTARVSQHRMPDYKNMV